jgi:DNA-binding transcriptional ArsR family regulator
VGRVVTIRPQCITALTPAANYNVHILDGACEFLVAERQLRNTYETNREVKYWATYFLLKAITTSGDIQNWRSQRQLILPFLQMNEPTLYSHLKALKQRGLLTIDRQFNIHLASFRRAAEILEIPYAGTVAIPYNPFRHEGKQVFQYFLRAEEFRYQQDRQLSALTYHLDKNPLLRNDLLLLLTRRGANQQRLLKDAKYLQERLLDMQMQSFKHGSEILEYVFTLRADINRSIDRIKKNHAYRSARSVSYLKQRMIALKVIKVEKVCVESKVRSRIYVPDPKARKGLRDGYKWIDPKKETAWFLTDQIKITYEPIHKRFRQDLEKKAA